MLTVRLTCCYRLLLAIIACSMIAACATTLPNVPSDFSLDTDSTGLVFFSLTQRGGQPLSIGIMNAATDEPVGVVDIGDGDQTFPPRVVGNQIIYEAPSGRLVVLRLPAGKYRFARWGSYVTVAYSNQTKHMSGWIGKEFEVLPGRAGYLGNLNVDFPGGSLSLFDQRERDVSMFHQLYPKVPRHAVVETPLR